MRLDGGYHHGWLIQPLTYTRKKKKERVRRERKKDARDNMMTSSEGNVEMFLYTQIHKMSQCDFVCLSEGMEAGDKTKA